MDKRQYMIVDINPGSKNKYPTGDIVSIEKCDVNNYNVQFNNGFRYKYGVKRLLFMSNPVSVDFKDKGVYYKRRKLEDISEILKFSSERHSYYYIIYYNVRDNKFCPEYCEERELHISRFSIEKDSGTLWEFIHKVILETGPRLDDGTIATDIAFTKVDTNRDDVPLAQYLGYKEDFKKHRLPKTVIYPFGCNASQKLAVERALANQLSVIEGPPGTGKTQTILNIIANLIIQGKSVLISSFNNSAVANVKEKLEKEGMDFIVAKIGSRNDKEEFFSNQEEHTIPQNWYISDISQEYSKVNNSLNVLKEAFSAKEAEMKATQILYDNKLEMQHNNIDDNYDTVPLFLKKLSSKKIMYRLEEYKDELEEGRKVSRLWRIIRIFKMGFKLEKFLNGDPATIINEMERAFYLKTDIEYRDIQNKAIETLRELDTEKAMKSLQTSSMNILKGYLAKRYSQKKRTKYWNNKSINENIDQFLYDYPVILSTTSSARNCIEKNCVFDYIIMDESSQIDVATGAVALSTANNAVIVGDNKQLPNVVTKETIDAVQPLLDEFNINEKYNPLKMSFLRSILSVFPTVSRTLLREHYRCHPLIIGFCNKMFYDNELICMTKNKGEENVLRVFRTVPGNHAREKSNQRECDVIKEEAMPLYADTKDIGIISPYNYQCDTINNNLSVKIAYTVHKFQGRECDTIIMSTVDNNITSFSNDPNLINVAISRAKKHFCLVITGNSLPEDSYLQQFIKYTEYNYMEVKNSKLRSVLDFLYEQRDVQKKELSQNSDKFNKNARTLRVQGENVAEEAVFNQIRQCLPEFESLKMGMKTHYSLHHLILNDSLLTEEEIVFANNPLTHIDCLLYNNVTYDPLLAIEFDGWTYHQMSEIQSERDRLKDSILDKIGLKYVRISSTELITKERIIEKIKNKLQ